VLVAGGAGAVGNAAIQLARWAGANVITTVSSPSKAELARAAGAHTVVNYRTENVVERVAQAALEGVDIVVEVAPVANAALNHTVLGRDGVVAVYATDSSPEVAVPVSPMMARNIRYQFVLVYTVTKLAKALAVIDVVAAVNAGAIGVGPERGLPLHRYPLAETAAAHAAVEAGAVGKVLIDVA